MLFMDIGFCQEIFGILKPNFFSLAAARKSRREFIGSGVAAKVAPPITDSKEGQFSKSGTYKVHVKTPKIL
jgi:hypothetical protein